MSQPRPSPTARRHGHSHPAIRLARVVGILLAVTSIALLVLSYTSLPNTAYFPGSGRTIGIARGFFFDLPGPWLVAPAPPSWRIPAVDFCRLTLQQFDSRLTLRQLDSFYSPSRLPITDLRPLTAWLTAAVIYFCIIIPRRNRRRDKGEGRCTTCGYGLWGLQSNRCPECGTQFQGSYPIELAAVIVGDDQAPRTPLAFDTEMTIRAWLATLWRTTIGREGIIATSAITGRNLRHAITFSILCYIAAILLTGWGMTPPGNIQFDNSFYAEAAAVWAAIMLAAQPLVTLTAWLLARKDGAGRSFLNLFIPICYLAGFAVWPSTTIAAVRLVTSISRMVGFSFDPGDSDIFVTIFSILQSVLIGFWIAAIARATNRDAQSKRTRVIRAVILCFTSIIAASATIVFVVKLTLAS